MKTVLRPFRLKPYNDKLVDGVVDSWLVFVRMNIIAIALCDAVAWSYWAHITATGMAGYLTAATAGLIVFFIVASVDASFVMHDTIVHHKTPATAGSSRAAKAVNWMRQHLHRGHLAIFVRIALVIISFTVTAPFLAQFFFSRDIAAAIQKNNESAQSAKRTEIAESYDRMILDTRMKLAARMGDLEKEVAGTGASGRYGKGPTAAAIEADIKRFQEQIQNTEKAKAAELEIFNHATPEQLASRYGIDFKREGPDTRAHAVAEMEKSPAFRDMRNNIKWFLAFMFLALMTLKFFQPVTVRHYYSADLQAAYHRYEQGLYNGGLDEREHPQNGGMTPAQFVRWYNENQREIEEHELFKNRVKRVTARTDIQSRGFAGLGGTISGELQSMREDLEQANAAKAVLDPHLADALSKLTSLRMKIAQQEQELAEFRYDNDANHEVSLRDGEFLVRRKQLFDRQLAANRTLAVESEGLVASLNQELEDNRVLRERVMASIEACGRKAGELDALRSEALRKSMADIASAG